MKLVDRAQAIWKLFTTGGLTKTDKWVLVLALLYCLSPVDIIPDFVPVVGFLDDLLVVLLTMRRFIRRTDAPQKDSDLIEVDAKLV